MFIERFPDIEELRVLDLGGTLKSWRLSPKMPRELTMLNPDRNDRSDEQVGACSARYLVGDACALPLEVTREEFDLVFSNSVIEHVGGHAQRLAFAESVHQAAPRSWVQTPYRYFPIEPHFVFPGAQFMPLKVRAQLPLRWTFGNVHRDDPLAAVRAAQKIDLLSITDMRAYFPDADLVLERVLGVPKSIIMVRDVRDQPPR
jgi:hypothetical protein